MRQAVQYYFSRSKMEIFFLKDCSFGFEGEIKKVKPGFAEKVLIPQVIALPNFPGYRKRLLPTLDESLLQNKIKRRQQIKLFHQKISGIYLDFVRLPKFSNPNLMKESIDQDTIIKEVESRFKLSITKNNLLSMVNRITTYGQVQLQVENYYSEELGDYINFPITVLARKPVMKVHKLIESSDVGTEGEQQEQKQQINAEQQQS